MTIITKWRIGEASDYTDTNPQLATGEIAIEEDTLKGKFGPGAWVDLPYSFRFASISEISGGSSFLKIPTVAGQMSYPAPELDGMEIGLVMLGSNAVENYSYSSPDFTVGGPADQIDGTQYLIIHYKPSAIP